MTAWGNALGGWRKQSRAKNGRFGSGSGGMALKGLHKMENGQTVKGLAQLAGSARLSVRPKIVSTMYIHSGDTVHGYGISEIRGDKFKAMTAYLRPESRGNKTVIAGVSKEVKRMQSDQVGRGRTVVIDRYRSADSERIVRNQAKRLGKQNVIVEPRYDPGFDPTDMIISSMDEGFGKYASAFVDLRNGNSKKAKKAKKKARAGVVN